MSQQNSINERANNIEVMIPILVTAMIGLSMIGYLYYHKDSNPNEQYMSYMSINEESMTVEKTNDLTLLATEENKVEATSSFIEHKVVSGNTMSAIVKEYCTGLFNCSEATILIDNPQIKNKNKLKIGETLVITYNQIE